jgi:hypothetical protein
MNTGLPFVWRRNDQCDLRGADAFWDGDPDQLLGLFSLPGIPWPGAE